MRLGCGMVQSLSLKCPRMMMAGVEMERQVMSQVPKSSINELQCLEG